MTNLPPDRGTTQSIRVEIGISLMKLRRLANYWIAIALARRQRQAEPGAGPGSEDPGEFGIYRYQVGGGPTNASQRRLNDPNPRPRADPERAGTHPRRKVYSKPARRKPST
jgi:hypothetical protein